MTFSKVKRPPTWGSKGHIESPGIRFVPKNDGFQVRFISKLPGGPHFQVRTVSFREGMFSIV